MPIFCKYIRLNTPQLDKLAYVNANLRVLEKAGALDDAGPINWNIKQVDHTKIVVEPADVSKLQPHTAEDDVYDFIREDMMRFTRQTRSSTRRQQGETSTVTSRGAPTTRARGARSRGRGRGRARALETDRLTPTPSELESDSEDTEDSDD